MWSWPTCRSSRLHSDYAGTSKTTCSLLQSMPIQRGSKHFQFSQQPQASLLTNSGVCSHSLGCQRSLWQTMDIALSVRNSSLSCMSMASSTSHLYHITRPQMASQRAVQIEKRMGWRETEGTLQSRLARILFAYWITPRSTTGVSPAELLFGWMPRSRLDLLRPKTAKRVDLKQFEQKANHDVSARVRYFKMGDGWTSDRERSGSLVALWRSLVPHHSVFDWKVDSWSDVIRIRFKIKWQQSPLLGLNTVRLLLIQLSQRILYNSPQKQENGNHPLLWFRPLNHHPMVCLKLCQQILLRLVACVECGKNPTDLTPHFNDLLLLFSLAWPVPFCAFYVVVTVLLWE